MNAEMGEGHVARRLGQEGSNLMGDPKFLTPGLGRARHVCVTFVKIFRKEYAQEGIISTKSIGMQPLERN